MATSSSKTLDHWRKVFRAAGESDVFHVIRQAISVAASERPEEFRSRRDKIVEMLFAALPGVEKVDVDRGNADVEAIEVKAMEEKEDDGRDNAVKAIEVQVNEEKEEESRRGNPVKSDGALFAAPTLLSVEQEPAPSAVAVVEEKAEITKKQETWKLSVSENGKIRLRRVLLHDQTKASKPETTFTEHHPAPRNQEGSLPTFTEHRHPEPGNDDDQEGSLRSNLEAAKRKLREGYQPFEPRPKKSCSRPLQFRISGARFR